MKPKQLTNEQILEINNAGNLVNCVSVIKKIFGEDVHLKYVKDIRSEANDIIRGLPTHYMFTKVDNDEEIVEKSFGSDYIMLFGKYADGMSHHFSVTIKEGRRYIK